MTKAGACRFDRAAGRDIPARDNRRTFEMSIQGIEAWSPLPHRTAQYRAPTVETLR